MVQFCLTPTLLSTRSKVIKYTFVKKSYTIIEIMIRKRDKNKLELGKGVGLRPEIYSFYLVVLYENDLNCIFMNLKSRTTHWK